VCKAIGLTPSAFSQWDDNSIPRTATLIKLSEYFNVPVEYFTDPDLPKDAISLLGEKIYGFRILGSVRAGYGGEAIEEYTEETLNIPSSFLEGRTPSECFALRVKGDSMLPNLLNGDIVLVERCSTVENGTTAVVMYNGEDATIKKVYYTDDGVELVPNNELYSTMLVRKPSPETFRILGKAIKLVRNNI
jgi:repressor LexA